MTDEIVTEAMVDAATRAAFPGGWELSDKIRVHDALRAVAPMIAARAFEQCRHIPGLEGKFAWRVGAREEREACAQIAEKAEPIVAARGTTTDRNLTRLMAHKIAAAIRARGET
jgi:hypothetical protein